LKNPSENSVGKGTRVRLSDSTLSSHCQTPHYLHIFRLHTIFTLSDSTLSSHCQTPHYLHIVRLHTIFVINLRAQTFRGIQYVLSMMHKCIMVKVREKPKDEKERK